jgi:hypothetical protein
MLYVVIIIGFAIISFQLAGIANFSGSEQQISEDDDQNARTNW